MQCIPDIFFKASKRQKPKLINPEAAKGNGSSKKTEKIRKSHKVKLQTLICILPWK